MTTATETPTEVTTDAEQTILDGQAKAQSLERERLSLQSRLHAAAGELATVQQDLLSRERSFTAEDQRMLPKLRQRRVELQLMQEDLGRLIPMIEIEMRSAIEQAAEAHKLVAISEYNLIVERQASITREMAVALAQFESTLRECLREKRDLAEKQVVIHVQRMGVPAPAVAVETLISLYKRDLVSVMSGSQVSIEYSAQRQDWTTRTMSETGELGARP